MDNLEKIKIYKKNSLYADFLFSYPSTYLFQKFIPSAEIDIHKLLSSSMSQNNILYIHIPFCYHICDFCNVYKEKVDFSLIEDYLSLLFLEIIEVGKTIQKIKGVYIAGGSPTILTEVQLKRLFQTIQNTFIFSEDFYIEIDAFPSTLTPAKLEVLQKYNVNQITIGIQSMDPQVLNNVGRKGQSYKEIDRLATDVAKFNFRLHFDFIVGLPGEDFEKLTQDVIYIAENFRPYSMSINSYDNTSDTVLFQKEKEYFRKKDYKIELGRRMEILEKLLLERYNISRKKTVYFQSFWEKHENIISTGAGAFGFINGYGVYRNLFLSEYLEKGFTFKQSIPFTFEDYKVMFLIHNYGGENINELYFSCFASTIIEDFKSQIIFLEKSGYVEIYEESKVKFLFRNNSLAKFHFIDFYTNNVKQYYL